MKVILKQEEIKLKESSDKSDKLLKELEIENKKAKRSEEHTSEPSHITISYAVFCLKKKTKNNTVPK